MAKAADKVYSAATTRDATSHPMADDLLHRTGKAAAQMLHAGLEAHDFEYIKTKAACPSDVISIAYAGTILVEHEFSLFVDALERIRQRDAFHIVLRFFGAHSYRGRTWFRREWMEEFGNLAEPQLGMKLRECTWGFAPMALDDADPRYNRYSFPTKFISYLAAGLPVITLGHADSSVVRMASEYQVGVVSSEKNSDALADTLRPYFLDRAPWPRFAGEVLRCAAKEFDATRMRAILYDCFSACALLSRERLGSPRTLA
jgi:hypothetical protein